MSVIGRGLRAVLNNKGTHPRPYHWLGFLHVCARLAKAENILDKKANTAQQTVENAPTGNK